MPLIRSFSVTKYKPYRFPTKVNLRPLTIFIGKNHSGKSALMKSLPLITGSLASRRSKALDLDALGLRHGYSDVDVVLGRTPHGSFELEIETTNPDLNREASSLLSVGLQCVTDDSNLSTSALVERLALVSSNNRLEINRQTANKYSVTFDFQDGVTGTVTELIDFEGLLPRSLPRSIPVSVLESTDRTFAYFRKLQDNLSYLKSPRVIEPGWKILNEDSTSTMICSGDAAPRLLATNDELLDLTRNWFSEAIGLTLDIQLSGHAFQVLIGSGSTRVGLENAGQGCTQILPVVVQKFRGRLQGDGVDIVEQPEAELHPAVHGLVADLFLDQLSSTRPAIVETHSEIFLLRVRRRVAEGHVDPSSIGIYWVHQQPDGTSSLREIAIDESGNLDSWPTGVFYEDFEEVLAIRRAGREKS